MFVNWHTTLNSMKTDPSKAIKATNKLNYPHLLTCSTNPKLWNFWITHAIIPWSKDLLERQKVPQLVENIPIFYRTRILITVFTTAHPWTSSWATVIQFKTCHSISLRPILTLSCHLPLGLASGHSTSSFPTTTVHALLLLYMCYMPCCQI